MGISPSDVVLTLQSSVAAGHVGNAGAAFALQRLGRDIMRIDTVRFSNHPKHGGYSGAAAPAEEIDNLVRGLNERGFLNEVGAVLSGYLGTAANAEAVGRAVDAVKRARPDALYCLDPVIGDLPHGQFVAEDVPGAIIATLAPRADIIIPNVFELECLTTQSARRPQDIVSSARAYIGAQDIALAVITGLHIGPDIANIAVTANDAWMCAAPLLDAPAYGAGDVFAALFLARYMEEQSPVRALNLATNAVHAVLRETAGRHLPELALIAAQAVLVDTPDHFKAERI